MKYSDFEKHMKKELRGSTEAVQMDALLASLNLGQEKPKRRGIFFWVLIPLLLLMVGSLAWAIWAPAEDSYANNSQHNLLTKDLQQPTEDIESTLNAVQLNESEGSLMEGTSSPSNVTFSASSTQKVKKTDLNTSKLNSNQPAPFSIKSTMEETSFSSSIPTNMDVKTLNASTPGTSLDMLVDSELGTSQEISQEDVSSISEEYLIEEAPIRKDVLLTPLPGADFSFEDEEVDEELFSRMKINCPSFDNAGWHMALIPEVGVFHPIKTLMNNSTEESAAFNERIASEQTLEGLEIALYGMLVRDNVPFYVKAGVAYSRISERMNLEYEYTEQDTSIGIISTTISGNGDTITHIYGDIITETTYKGSNRQHHYIHLFDVPVAIGYTTFIAGLDVGFEAGVRFNFMTRATGNLLTSQREYTNLSLNRLFKNRIGLSYFGGIMIGRNFGRLGDFYIAPRFTYFPTEFNNQNNSVSQKYINIGISAGVVYKIN